MSGYDLAFAFWSLLAEEKADLAGGWALANRDVPYLLSNAAWYAKAERLGEVVPWCEARGLPPAVTVPGASAPQPALVAAGFSLELTFGFREVRGREGSSLVEQVSWTQTRYAGELLAAHYEQPDLALAIGQSLSRALQADSRVQAFLSYRDAPVGTMITFEDEETLAATVLLDADGSLEARLKLEAKARGKRALVLEALPEGVRLSSKRGLERWSRR